MAQYQRNFYGSSLYGRIKAFYGEYTTEIFDAQEPFSSHVNADILAQIPSTTYVATTSDFTRITTSDWFIRGTDLITTKANSPVEWLTTGDNLEVQVRLQNQGSQTMEAKLYKEELVSGAYQWVLKETKSLSTLSAVSSGMIGVIAFSSFGYGDYKVSIQALATTAEGILVGGKVRTSDLTLKIRTSADLSTWSSWEAVNLTKTLQDSQYEVTGQGATIYNNVRYVQGMLELYSSDSTSSPVIDRIELRSDDSGLYTNDGTYTLYLNMNTIASAASKTFKKLNKIKWVTSSQPQGTQMYIRTSSSRDNIFWGPISAPYSKSPRRLRLKKGATNHSIIVGPIQESDKFSFSQITSMNAWDTQAFSPKDPGNTSISYYFSKTKTNQTSPENKLYVIDDLYHEQSRSLSFAPQPYFLTVKMTRSTDAATPVVDWINIDQTILYKEAPSITGKDISAVDQAGTGLVSLQKISDYVFTYPKVTGLTTFNTQNINGATLTYQLKDKTNRPTEVILYLKSEENKGLKTNESVSASDEIMAKILHRRLEMGDTTGVITHYQTAQGKVQYLRPYEREMDSVFTPSLLSTKRYRYYLLNGWPDDVHITIEGEELNDVAIMHSTTVSAIQSLNSDILINENGTLIGGQTLKIPNSSLNAKVTLVFHNGTLYTVKSGHNAYYDQANGKTVTDFSSEVISISVTTEPPKGYVPWVSEEKIYSGVINFNDIRSEFLRTQYNRSTHSGFNRKYVVASGDTWESIALKFDVHLQDLQVANDGVELNIGSTIIVPPNILLPDLAAEAEFDSANPYEISIIPDSVHKKNGIRLDESFIPIPFDEKHLPMKVDYRESSLLTAVVKRGDDPNGKDPLPLSHVLRIETIQNKAGTITYHEWNGSFGDFKLTSNYIDWSPDLAGSIEPSAGEEYVVTYVRNEVDSVEIYLDSDYFEQLGTDLVWRSAEVKVYDGICTPTQNFEMKLPLPESFEGYKAIYQNIGYVVEDNDLWVETKVENRSGEYYLIGSLNGKDPSKNWYPTIRTGYYYLKEQEHYLYSEPIQTILDEKELPTAEGIEYVKGPNGIGALLLPSGQNLIKDSAFDSTNWKKAKVFSVNSI